MKLFVWDCFADSTVLAIAETVEQAIELIIDDVKEKEFAIYKAKMPGDIRYHKRLLIENNPDVRDCDTPFGSWEKDW